MHINSASLSSCSTPVVISKKGNPSGDLIIERVFLYSINMAFTISVGIPYMIKIYFIFSRFIESKACEKSIKRRVAGRFFYFTSSSIRRMVKIFLSLISLFRNHFNLFLV